MSPVELYFCGCGSEGGAPRGLSAPPPPHPTPPPPAPVLLAPSDSCQTGGRETRQGRVMEDCTCSRRPYGRRERTQDTALDRLPDASEEQGNTKRDYFFPFPFFFFFKGQCIAFYDVFR
ncbi:unnamed protein product [Boreogadus saida]